MLNDQQRGHRFSKSPIDWSWVHNGSCHGSSCSFELPCPSLPCLHLLPMGTRIFYTIRTQADISHRSQDIRFLPPSTPALPSITVHSTMVETRKKSQAMGRRARLLPMELQRRRGCRSSLHIMNSIRLRHGCCGHVGFQRRAPC